MSSYPINPVPKPRMTQRDRWAKRPPVLRYFAFCDEVKAQGVKLENCGEHIVFKVPMPKSWSNKKKAEMEGKPHQQRPDIDNYLKSLLDAVFDDDATVWDVRATKVWAETGSIEITQS